MQKINSARVYTGKENWQSQPEKIAHTDSVCPSARFYDYARAASGQAWNSLTDYILRSGPRKQPYACLITRQKGWRVDIFWRHFQQRLHYKVNGEQNQNILKVTFTVMVSLNVNNAMSKILEFWVKTFSFCIKRLYTDCRRCGRYRVIFLTGLPPKKS